MSLALETDLLREIQALNDAASLGASEFLSDQELTALARRFETNLKKRHVNLGFNLFAIVSDLYYRENFHSDILKAVLDPEATHGEKTKYLHLFLAFIQLHGAGVASADYANAEVVREEGKIDILIKDDASRKAIIVENKINGAPDMPRQLPRYLEIVTAAGYSCDTIIYLRLNGHAGPDVTGWTATDKRQIKALIKVIPAYDETEVDLLNGWLVPCQKAAHNPDAQHLLRQYTELIKKLGSNIMNKPVMENFYKLVLQGENLKTALSVRAMLDDLILYRVERLREHFQYDLAPFDRIANYQGYDAYFTGLYWKDAHLGIDIVVTPESYNLQFWDRKDRPGTKGHAKVILQKMGCLPEFVILEGLYTKVFSFPSQEEGIIAYVTTFKQQLATAITSQNP